MDRLTTGITCAVIWLAIIYIGSFTFAWAIITLLTILALYEFLSINIFDFNKNFMTYSLCIGSLPVLISYSGRLDVVMAGFIAAVFLFSYFPYIKHVQARDPYLYMVRATYGAAYVGLCSAHLVLILTLEKGFFWIFILTAITAASDTGAYYTGSSIGKTKLCPRISPGKTVEGFVGGVVAAVISACCLAVYLFPEKNILKIALLAVFITTAGVIGDITESIMKRSNQVKDSGRILPGHGGVLDRVDSILAAAPALFYLIHFEMV